MTTTIPTRLAVLLALTIAPAQAQTLLDQGYRMMYNLEFAAAHQAFHQWESTHPADPMGPASDAAAYLFAEFDRLHILQSEFFTQDDSFFKRQKELSPDPTAKREFESALDRTSKLITEEDKRKPGDVNAQLANLMRIGLKADYLALIEKRNMAALSELKQSRMSGETLIAQHPDCYDAYLAVGVESYMLSLKPAAVRWMLRLGGAQTDKQAGIERLSITAEKGRYLLPYARLLLAVAALRDKNLTLAKSYLQWLSKEFPQNQLYREELQKLK